MLNNTKQKNREIPKELLAKKEKNRKEKKKQRAKEEGTGLKAVPESHVLEK